MNEDEIWGQHKHTYIERELVVLVMDQKGSEAKKEESKPLASHWIILITLRVARLSRRQGDPLYSQQLRPLWSLIIRQGKREREKARTIRDPSWSWFVGIELSSSCLSLSKGGFLLRRWIRIFKVRRRHISRWDERTLYIYNILALIRAKASAIVCRPVDVLKRFHVHIYIDLMLLVDWKDEIPHDDNKKRARENWKKGGYHQWLNSIFALHSRGKKKER